MSLEACPTCGYALSTETAQCRHCSATQRATSQIKIINSVQPMHAVALVVTIGCAIYLLFFR